MCCMYTTWLTTSPRKPLQLAAPPADFEALRQAYRLDARLQPLA